MERMEKQVVMEKEFEKEFVTYELALRMKQIGFDEPCFGHYQQEWHDDGMTELEPSLQMIISKQHQHAYQIYTAPTFSQAFRWFREKYGICTNIRRGSATMHEHMQKHGILVKDYEWSLNTIDGNYLTSMGVEDTWEEAELVCLTKLIELVENEKML
jgi:hypothetical protein